MRKRLLFTLPYANRPYVHLSVRFHVSKCDYHICSEVFNLVFSLFLPQSPWLCGQEPLGWCKVLRWIHYRPVKM